MKGEELRFLTREGICMLRICFSKEAFFCESIVQPFNHLLTSPGVPSTSWEADTKPTHSTANSSCHTPSTHSWHRSSPISDSINDRDTRSQSCHSWTFQHWNWSTKKRNLHPTNKWRKSHLPTCSRSLGLREAPICVRLSLLQRKRRVLIPSFLPLKMKVNWSWIISVWNISMFCPSEANQLEQRESSPSSFLEYFWSSMNTKKHDKNCSENNLPKQLRTPGCERNEAWNKLIRAWIQQEQWHRSNELGGGRGVWGGGRVNWYWERCF